MDLKILLKKFFPTISIVVIILCLSLMRVSPRSDMPEVPFGDKIVHVVMYMGLMLVFYFDVYRQNLPKSSFRRSLLYGLFAFWVFGGIVELLQMYCTTYRSGDWWDWPMSLESSWACGSVNMLCCLPSSFFHRGFFVDNGTISFFPFSVVFFESYCKSYLSE